MPHNAFYAQSGGVTAVINASAAGVINEVMENPEQIGKLYAGRDGILGALNEELIDVSQLTEADLSALAHTPAGAFGSCRYKLKSLAEHGEEYRRILAVFEAHDIRYFFYNGGGDSQDTAQKMAQMAEQLNYPLTCIGIPKTIDNDLPVTDASPGFGSVAKYAAVSCLEASFDLASMHSTSTKVFIMEVMGRHAGWIAAATGLALGRAAVRYALAGENAIMPIIVRTQDEPYQWHIDKVPLSEVANREKTLPAEFISPDGFHITDAARRYLSPLIEGETYPPYRRGLPAYRRFELDAYRVAKTLDSY